MLRTAFKAILLLNEGDILKRHPFIFVSFHVLLRIIDVVALFLSLRMTLSWIFEWVRLPSVARIPMIIVEEWLPSPCLSPLGVCLANLLHLKVLRRSLIVIRFRYAGSEQVVIVHDWMSVLEVV